MNNGMVVGVLEAMNSLSASSSREIGVADVQICCLGHLGWLAILLAVMQVRGNACMTQGQSPCGFRPMRGNRGKE